MFFIGFGLHVHILRRHQLSLVYGVDVELYIWRGGSLALDEVECGF